VKKKVGFRKKALLAAGNLMLNAGVSAARIVLKAGDAIVETDSYKAAKTALARRLKMRRHVAHVRRFTGQNGG
jgi:hypothetical protein